MAPDFELNALAEATGRVRGELLTSETAESAVQLLAEVAAELVPQAAGAGVTLIRDGRPTSTGSTNSTVRMVDAIQYETGQGPCLTSWAASSVVNVVDARTETRWPLWAAAAVEVPVLSCVSVPLVNGRDTIGAMKVYAVEPNAFAGETTRLLNRLAAAASALLAHIQTSETPLRINHQLAEVLRIRDLTNMAKGVLITRGMSAAEAQSWLLEASRRQRRPVAEVARDLVGALKPEEGADEGA
ncbi:GAF and ANTAR domain-containing protein [Brevibacterium daeguense]|uniref:GAF and ANTAR domain-containing protein n=1 Tax=Brevibacterium daeguense TaxID=909936 RepID=A0ABP8EFM7_9MICO|nr:GAF and ANTAR domain-containing protein [Brevibacterium daeguense]